MIEPPQRRLSSNWAKKIIYKSLSRLTEDCTSPTIVSSELKKGNLKISSHNYSVGTDRNLYRHDQAVQKSKQARVNVIAHIVSLLED